MLIFSILKLIFLSRFIIASFVFLYFTETVFLVSFTLKLTPRCLNEKKKNENWTLAPSSLSLRSPICYQSLTTVFSSIVFKIELLVVLEFRH